MVRQLLRLMIIGMLAAVLAAPARAQDDLAAQSDFFREGESARAFGLGSAFVGLSDDVSAIYWNPAGLARLPGPQVLTTRTTLEFFDSSIQTVSAAMPWGRGAFGISYSAASTDFALFGQNPQNPQRYNYPLGIASEKYSGLALAYAMQYRPNLFVGFSIKSLKYDLFGNSASGTGFDVGALMQLDEDTSVGMNLQNIGGVSLGEMDEVPMNIQLGAAKKVMDGAATVAAGYDTKYLGDSGFGLGVEYKAAEHFTLRLGSYDGDTAYGFSVDYQGFRLDYALNSGSDEKEMNKFTIMKTFDTGAPGPKPKAKVDKKQQAAEAEAEKLKQEELKQREEEKKKKEEEKKKEEDKKKKEEEKKKKEEDKKKKEQEEKEKKEKEDAENKKKEEEALKVGKEPSGVNAGDEGKAWFEQDQYYTQPKEQIKLPSFSDVVGTSKPGTTSEGEIKLPQPAPDTYQPQRFPTGQQGSYGLSHEYDGQVP